MLCTCDISTPTYIIKSTAAVIANGSTTDVLTTGVTYQVDLGYRSEGANPLSVIYALLPDPTTCDGQSISFDITNNTAYSTSNDQYALNFTVGGTGTVDGWTSLTYCEVGRTITVTADADNNTWHISTSLSGTTDLGTNPGGTIESPIEITTFNQAYTIELDTSGSADNYFSLPDPSTQSDGTWVAVTVSQVATSTWNFYIGTTLGYTEGIGDEQMYSGYIPLETGPAWNASLPIGTITLIVTGGYWTGAYWSGTYSPIAWDIPGTGG